MNFEVKVQSYAAERTEQAGQAAQKLRTRRSADTEKIVCSLRLEAEIVQC